MSETRPPYHVAGSGESGNRLDGAAAPARPATAMTAGETPREESAAPTDEICPLCAPERITAPGSTPGQRSGKRYAPPAILLDLKVCAQNAYHEGAIEILLLQRGAANIVTALHTVELDPGAWLFVRFPSVAEATEGEMIRLLPPMQTIAP